MWTHTTNPRRTRFRARFAASAPLPSALARNDPGLLTKSEPRQRVAMECGTHSPWVSRLLKKLGHQVIVANACKLRAISQNDSKNDRQDAVMLARLDCYVKG